MPRNEVDPSIRSRSSSFARFLGAGNGFTLLIQFAGAIVATGGMIWLYHSLHIPSSSPVRHPWPPIFLLVIPVWLWIDAVRAFRLHYLNWQKDTRTRLGLCLFCGYDLRAAEGICPECGQEMQATRPVPTPSPSRWFVRADVRDLGRMLYDQFWKDTPLKNKSSKPAAIAYIALGANLGDRSKNLREALVLLDATAGITVKAVSSFLENPAVGGPVDSPAFLNAVAGVETTLPPRELLNRLLEIERKLGRERREKWGPRTIDLDILLYGDTIVRESDLVIPHPRLHERRFVLQPLAELAPNLVVPGTGQTVRNLLSEIQDSPQRHKDTKK